MAKAARTQLNRFRQFIVEVDPKRDASAWQPLQQVIFSIYHEEKLTLATDNPMSADFGQVFPVVAPGGRTVFEGHFAHLGQHLVSKARGRKHLSSRAER